MADIHVCQHRVICFQCLFIFVCSFDIVCISQFNFFNHLYLFCSFSFTETFSCSAKNWIVSAFFSTCSGFLRFGGSQQLNAITDSSSKLFFFCFNAFHFWQHFADTWLFIFVGLLPNCLSLCAGITFHWSCHFICFSFRIHSNSFW